MISFYNPKWFGLMSVLPTHPLLRVFYIFDRKNWRVDENFSSTFHSYLALTTQDL